MQYFSSSAVKITNLCQSSLFKLFILSIISKSEGCKMYFHHFLIILKKIPCYNTIKYTNMFNFNLTKAEKSVLSQTCNSLL